MTKTTRKALVRAIDRVYSAIDSNRSVRDNDDRIRLGTIWALRRTVGELRAAMSLKMHHLVTDADLADAERALDRAADAIMA